MPVVSFMLWEPLFAFHVKFIFRVSYFNNKFIRIYSTAKNNQNYKTKIKQSILVLIFKVAVLYRRQRDLN